MFEAFDLVANIIKGDINVDEKTPTREWFSTGSTLLDLGITNDLPGGIPSGRAIQIYGGASSCKTVMACTVMGAAIRKGALGFYADIEYTLDERFAKLYGLDCESKNFFKGFSFSKKIATSIDSEANPSDIQPETIEEFFDVWVANIIKLYGSKPKILVVDSLTALPSESEVNKKMSEQGFGGNDRAKKIGLALRKYNARMAATNTTLFIVDQSRDNIGVTFGDKEVTTGGRGPEFYSSVRVQLKHERNIINTKEKVIGIWVKFTVKKNKVGEPLRNGYFKVLFKWGLDDVHSNLRFLVDAEKGTKTEGLKKTAKVTLKLPDKEGKLTEITKTIKAWIPYIEDNNLEDVLIQTVRDTYIAQYDAGKRKMRKWK
jgi:recombination protein RecA